MLVIHIHGGTTVRGGTSQRRGNGRFLHTVTLPVATSSLRLLGDTKHCTMAPISRIFSTLPVFIVSTLFLLYVQPTSAIKFELSAYRYPPAKCIWNAAHPGALVIVTANVGPGDHQRVDIEIVDAGAEKNVYLSKKAIKAESRFAITAHSEGDVGVCFRNYLEPGASSIQFIRLEI